MALVRLDVTLTVDPAPRHTAEAVGVKPLIFGLGVTGNVDVFPDDKVLLHKVELFCIEVTVTVVLPLLPSKPAPIVKEPLPPTVVSDAVFPEEVFPPVRLKVTV